MIKFLIVLIYHIFTEICSCTKANLMDKVRLRRLNIDEDDASLVDYELAEDHQLQPTVSWIDAPKQEETLTDQTEINATPLLSDHGKD